MLQPTFPSPPPHFWLPVGSIYTHLENCNDILNFFSTLVLLVALLFLILSGQISCQTFRIWDWKKTKKPSLKWPWCKGSSDDSWWWRSTLRAGMVSHLPFIVWFPTVPDGVCYTWQGLGTDCWELECQLLARSWSGWAGVLQEVPPEYKESMCAMEESHG